METSAILERMAPQPFDAMRMANDPNRTTVADMVDPAAELIAQTYENSRKVARVAGGALALGAVAALPALAIGAEAPASTGTPVVTMEAPVVTLKAASSSARSVARADLNTRVVLAYRSAKGTPRAELRRMEREDDQCRIDNNYWNSATILGQSRNRPAFFTDRRLSILCRNEDSPTGWVRVGTAKNRKVLNDGFQASRDVVPGTDCYNIAQPKIEKKPSKIVKNPLVVRSFDEAIKISVTSKAKAAAVCSPETYAYAEGFASASTRITVRALLRSRGAARDDFIAKINGRAYTDASAQANCASSTVEIRQIPPTVVPPKDGTKGPGEGTPGPVGGPGAGGAPGNAEQGVVCRDPADATNGDKNPATEGELLYGTQADQIGYCVGEAKPLT